VSHWCSAAHQHKKGQFEQDGGTGSGGYGWPTRKTNIQLQFISGIENGVVGFSAVVKPKSKGQGQDPQIRGK